MSTLARWGSQPEGLCHPGGLISYLRNPQTGGSNPPLAIFFLNFILETIKYRFWQKRPLMADYNVIVCNNGSPGKPSCIAWVREVNYVVVFDYYD